MSNEYRGRYGGSLGFGNGSGELFNDLSSVSKQQKTKRSIDFVPKFVRLFKI